MGPGWRAWLAQGMELIEPREASLASIELDGLRMSEHNGSKVGGLDKPNN